MERQVVHVLEQCGLLAAQPRMLPRCEPPLEVELVGPRAGTVVERAGRRRRGEHPGVVRLLADHQVVLVQPERRAQDGAPQAVVSPEHVVGEVASAERPSPGQERAGHFGGVEGEPARPQPRQPAAESMRPAGRPGQSVGVDEVHLVAARLQEALDLGGLGRVREVVGLADHRDAPRSARVGGQA